MTALVSTIEVALPAREVFAFATDPLRFDEWQSDVVAVRMLDEAGSSPPGGSCRGSPSLRKAAPVSYQNLKRILENPEPPPGARWSRP